MAVGESVWPEMHAIDGITIGVTAAGIKYDNRHDVCVFAMEEGTAVAGVFTQNAFSAAPVHICKEHLSKTQGYVRGLVINSGNANACTGEEGHEAALESCRSLSGLLRVDAAEVLPFSTGVIGEPLPVRKITRALPGLLFDSADSAWLAAAKAIMTTDTRPKGASCVVRCGDAEIKVTGIAKGSGMIKPNMATMLGFVATDATVDPELLQRLSLLAANRSFNRITIDGDTSTNDSCVVMATGRSAAPAITDENSPYYTELLNALVEVHQSLAQQIVLDGEGATKFVTLDIQGGGSAQECLDVAYAIGHSPLVKTAIFAADPNWGRIVAAIGYASVEQLDASLVRVWLDDVLIVENGGRATSYQEEAGQAVFDRESFTIKVDLGRGQASEILWFSDLSHEYIRINAEYRS